MILIIAEKPSLGRNIASAIGNMSKRDGYLEGNGYIVTWAFGHLFSLCDIEHYNNPGSTTKSLWSMDTIPCFPDKFDFELKKDRKTGKTDPGIVKQFNTICRLASDISVDTIVNAGDADREGEIIVRLCLQNAITADPSIASKSIYRLWLPDQTPETIRAQLSSMKMDKDYDNLASEGLARTFVDWLYGVNLTRYATLKMGSLLRVGRVIVPIVKAIYDRDMAIRKFVPGKYLSPVSKEKTNGEEIELTSKQQFEPDQTIEVQKLCDEYNAAGATVTSVKHKKETSSPGKLYSLTKLQNHLGKKYKMPMEESLKIAQKLYEDGYLTYPRTNSEYLAVAEKDKIKKIIDGCVKLGYPLEFKDNKSIFDDSKIESHSALTPTFKIPSKDKLSENEYKVYSAVMRRFAAVFCKNPCIVNRTTVTVVVNAKDPEEFTLKGTIIEEPGWTALDDSNIKDKILPPLKKGDAVNIDFIPVEKQTSPPKHYTIETLNNYLKNPFKEDRAAAKDNTESPENDADDYKAIFEGLELGTEATRTGIIDNAKKSKYIELKKDTYTILPGGEYLVESLQRLNISMDKYKTSTLGKALKKVYRNDITVNECVTLAVDEIKEIFSYSSDSNDNNIGIYGDIVGKCPLCGKDVIQKGKFYGCSGYKDGCKFTVNTYICGRSISRKAIEDLLNTGNSGRIDGFISNKTKKTFSASLVIKDGKAVFDFGNDAVQISQYGNCPLCGKPLIKGKTAYGCSGWKEGCPYRKPFDNN